MTRPVVGGTADRAGSPSGPAGVCPEAGAAARASAGWMTLTVPIVADPGAGGGTVDLSFGTAGDLGGVEPVEPVAHPEDGGDPEG
jgi:hypothetical protein